MMRAWSVYVELATTAVDDDTIDQLHEGLSEHHAAIGSAPNGNLSVQMSVDTRTARQAVDTALKAVTRVAKAQGLTSTVCGVELVTEEELDRRLSTPDIPALVGLSEIAAQFGVTRQRAGQLAQRDTFPPVVAHLKAGPVYIADQVDAFERRWQRAAGRPKKTLAESRVEQNA